LSVGAGNIGYGWAGVGFGHESARCSVRRGPSIDSELDVTKSWTCGRHSEY
jgi:hypothetical protein